MMKLSGFADEISPDLTQQIGVLKVEGIKYLEFRSVGDKNVLKLNDSELMEVKVALERNHIRVSSIGSPVGKISIKDDFEAHLLELERAIFVAELFETKYIRMFSFVIPKEEDPEKYRHEVIHRMKLMVKRAEDANVILLHENEAGMYGDIQERCLDLLETCSSLNLRQAFDPGNLVQCGGGSIMEAYQALKPFIEYVHIKDAASHNGKEVPAGMGDGQIPELLQQLHITGYNGFLSLEPHLTYSGMYPDKTPKELFIIASQALKIILEKNGINWV
jgi:3-dehydroshikimate dehydratase